MGGSRSRRTGVVTLLLLVLSAGGTTALAWKLKPDSAADWASVAAGVVILPGLYLAWSSYRDDRAAEKQILTLPEVADQLAVAVRAQWAAEVELRRLNDPYALPVRWEAAPVDLVEDWATLERLATSGGAGWPPPPPQGTWASGPAGLAGTGGGLVDVLDRIPTGRLVVLGEPGAGKTIVLARLAVDLLAEGRREPGGPVPVLLPLASWDPGGQRLDDWVESRLVADYPGLDEPAPDVVGKTRTRRLWEAGLLLLLLDGLDEIPAAVRGTAVAKINEMVRPGQRLVVTSRIDPYQDALHPPSGVEVCLAGAAGVQLCPLHSDDVAAYLRDSAGGPTAAARWDPILDTLTQTPAPPAAQALSTPLMASLARTIYNPRPGEPAIAVGRSPAELLDPIRFPTRTAIEQHLFDGYLPAAYRLHPDPAQRCRWNPSDAERWLAFLARHLDYTLGGTPNLAWWQLSRAAFPHGLLRRSLLFVVVIGPPVGLPIGLASGLAGGPVFGIASGILFGILAAGVADAAEEGRRPLRSVRWRATHVPELVALMAATFGYIIGRSRLPGGIDEISDRVAAGAVGGLTVALATRLSTTPANLANSVRPALVLQQDRAAFRSFLLAFGLIGGIIGGFIAGLVGPRTVGPLGGAAGGLMFGLSIGFIVGLAETLWGMFVLARTWLAARGCLPRDLMAFLDDAHHRGVLRQAGAVYQFRHIELQHRLASRT